MGSTPNPSLRINFDRLSRPGLQCSGYGTMRNRPSLLRRRWRTPAFQQHVVDQNQLVRPGGIPSAKSRARGSLRTVAAQSCKRASGHNRTHVLHAASCLCKLKHSQARCSTVCSCPFFGPQQFFHREGHLPAPMQTFGQKPVVYLLVCHHSSHLP